MGNQNTDKTENNIPINWKLIRLPNNIKIIALS